MVIYATRAFFRYLEIQRGVKYAWHISSGTLNTKMIKQASIRSFDTLWCCLLLQKTILRNTLCKINVRKSTMYLINCKSLIFCLRRLCPTDSSHGQILCGYYYHETSWYLDGVMYYPALNNSVIMSE